MFENVNLLIESAKDVGVSLNANDVDKFSLFYNLVIESNKAFNLTAITDENDFIIKHLIDSISAAKFFPINAKVLDIGAGAGFPSIPLAIVRPDLKITALDSTSKKMAFVLNAANQLCLSNITTVSGRAEEQTKLFSSFDAVTARAVSSLNILLELSFPLLKKGGLFIAYKTDTAEYKTSQSAFKTLGGSLLQAEKFKLPNGDNRVIFVFKKDNDTPQIYPRKYGMIKKKPL